MDKIKVMISKHKEFIKLGRLERIQMHLREPTTFVLKEYDRRYLNKLVCCFSIMESCSDTNEIAKRYYGINVSDDNRLTISKAKRIVQDAKKVFSGIRGNMVANEQIVA